MTPVWIIEGAHPGADPVAERNIAERKLAALRDAVRKHQLEIGGHAPEPRPQDRHLYDRLREICGEA